MSFDPGNWLDVWNIFEFEIVGSFWLAMFLGIVIIIYFCMKYSANIQTTILIILTFTLGISAIKAPEPTLWVFSVYIIGLISYYLISKTIKRG
jgi:hypothetical protein